MKINTTKRNISWHIDNRFREYAIYTLQSRGIPSFDDSLTTVQRLILKNAKPQLEKTLSLIGSCISDGYSHGDNSLAGAISKITRDFNCSINLLEGKGFWGTPVVHDPAAPRYTSVKIRNDIKQNYLKYGYLDEKVDEVWNPLYFDVPIGLANLTTGIAVGYKSLILPRKIEDMKDFLDGKIKEVNPYFRNFKGKISKFNSTGGWLIKGTYRINRQKQMFIIEDVPHIIKYASFMNKIYKAIDAEEINCKVHNDSAEKIEVKIEYNQRDFKKLKDIIDKNIKIIVNESLVFIKGNSVITYKCIEDYLTDYKIRIRELIYKDYEYKFNLESFNLEYERAKLEFLLFMTAKKRKRQEVLDFLKGYNDKISTKLDSIKLTKLNKETISETRQEIKRLEKLVASHLKSVNKYKKEYDDMLKNFKFTGNITSANSALFDEEEQDEIDGISVFTLEEDEEEDNENSDE